MSKVSIESSLVKDDYHEEEKDFDVLPVVEYKREILQSIKDNRVVIIISETGSGKTTQIPQFCADDEELSRDLKIAVTQPRRVAAITVAQRVSHERRCSVGSTVGYAVRFDDCTSDRTKIKFMTDGVLLRECLADKYLAAYSVVMLDEAHERSMNTDILFGLLKEALSLRDDLKVVVTSATLNASKLSTYFNNCPVLQVPGRMYPVDLYHSKTKQVMTVAGPSNSSYVDSAVEIALKIHREAEQGHILMFLTGQEEIEKACNMLQSAIDSDPTYTETYELLILPLYASLPTDEQQKVFLPAHRITSKRNYNNSNNSSSNGGSSQYTSFGSGATAGAGSGSGRGIYLPVVNRTKDTSSSSSKSKYIRKCVIATNIAETSITVPQVRYVVDSGFVKQKAYDPERHMESLIIVPISQVAAQQRAGRAGRTGPGQCYRLYSSECLRSMEAETVPEILRTHMANAVLYLKILNVNGGDVLGFDFLDPPSEQQIIEALQQLHMLGALDNEGNITVIGRQMSGLPLDPCLSRMLLESCNSDLNCFEEVAIVAAMLSTENIWYTRSARQRSLYSGSSSSSSSGLVVGRSSKKDDEAVQAHAKLYHAMGDHITLLNIFMRWQDDDYSVDWCEENFVRIRSLKTARKIRDQLIDELVKARCIPATATTTDTTTASYRGGHHNHNHNNSHNSHHRKVIDGHNDRDTDREAKDRDMYRRVCAAVCAGFFCNAARKSANSDSIFHSSFAWNGHGNTSSNSSNDGASSLRILHAHPSSVISSSSCSAYHAAVASGCKRSPDFVVYQDLVFSGGKAFMRNVSWMDTDTLRLYQKRWTPVAHPCMLSNRLPPPPPPPPAAVSVAKGVVGVKRGRDRGRDDHDGRTGSTTNSIDRSGENKQASIVDSAKARYLARKQLQK